jgi:hypothetical protein
MDAQKLLPSCLSSIIATDQSVTINMAMNNYCKEINCLLILLA